MGVRLVSYSASALCHRRAASSSVAGPGPRRRCARTEQPTAAPSRELHRPADLDRDNEAADALDGPLQDAIARALRPPAHEGQNDGESKTPAGARLRDFLGETLRLLLGSVRLPEAGLASVDLADQDFAEPDRRRARQVGAVPNARPGRPWVRRPPQSDPAAALFCSGRRRHPLFPRLPQRLLLAYFLSTLAVAVTLMGTLPFLPHDGPESLRVKAILVTGELVLIGAVIVIVAAGRRGRWHERWMDTRALAEQLRHVRFLSLLGETNASRAFGRSSTEGAGWASWYLRATIRELGLPYGALDQACQRKVLLATRENGLTEQLDFNRKNS